MWNYLFGIAALAFGIYSLIDRYKNPIPEERDYLKANMAGYMAGILGITLGIILIMNEMKK